MEESPLRWYRDGSLELSLLDLACILTCVFVQARRRPLERGLGDVGGCDVVSAAEGGTRRVVHDVHGLEEVPSLPGSLVQGCVLRALRLVGEEGAIWVGTAWALCSGR